MKSITILELLNMNLREYDRLYLRCLAGRSGLGRKIFLPDLNRPGLTLAGFFDNFASERIQVYGLGEASFHKTVLHGTDSKQYLQHFHDFFQADIPCVVLPHSLELSETMREFAEQSATPILQTSLSTSEFSSRVTRALSKVFARRSVVHGVLVEVFGIGIFIMGKSGVGKSESALELIHRGHRLVADDVVEIKNVAGNLLVGSPRPGQAGTNDMKHNMEIRGLGIIDIARLFGVGAIRDHKRIQLIVELENWDSDKEYDRLGSEVHTKELLDIPIPYLLVPVKPGRNIPIIIETAAMNLRLKKMGQGPQKGV